MAQGILLAFFLAAALVFFLPRLFHISQHVVLSGSMEPAIRTGSLCFIDHRAGLGEIREGDAVAFERIDGSLVVHRAVREEKGQFVTRGDANPAEDLARVTKENYLGKAVLSVPYLGYAVMFLQRREVKAAAGILAAAFFLKELLSAINKEGKPYEKT
ncbi:signal peptidase I [Blautia marasmi]|uniref:signal peptidase I n=1 Tax=Blautia marasmi TaxID=1917868 RepID=UPI0039A2BF3D